MSTPSVQDALGFQTALTFSVFVQLLPKSRKFRGQAGGRVLHSQPQEVSSRSSP